MRRVAFAVPGDLSTPTGGYAYDARIIAGLRARGWDVDLRDIGAGFPRPDPAALHAARNTLARIAEDIPLVIDGLAYGVMPQTAPALAARHPLIALVHHPLALETGLSHDDAQMFRQSERDALSFAHHAIVTSPSTARVLMADYAVPEQRISVVRPGVDPAARQARMTQSGTISLLAVGAIVPRKGHDVLVEALGGLRDLPWRLVIVGDTSRDQECASQLRHEIARLDLKGRVSLEGAVPAERLATLYREADVFVLASRHEGYGMAYAEALAHGLPVIGTTAGAIPDTVPAGAGILVAPDDVAALAEALRRAIGDDALRMQLAARAERVALPSWDEAAAEFERAIKSVMPGAPV